MFPDIHPDLALHAEPGAVVIEVRVQADPPRALAWRLSVDTKGPGGSSRISQSGRTDGAGSAPLAVVRVNNPGRAQLEVFQGETLAARSDAEIAPGAK